MRLFKLLRLSQVFVFVCFISASNLYSQTSVAFSFKPEALEWLDETHYLFQTIDNENNPVLQKVDINTGKSVLYKPVKTKKELLADKLPAPYTITGNDIVSPDMGSVVLVRENDLFYFSDSDNEVIRLTENADPEMNTRFSPDGGKIAYTRNKDLYVYDFINKKEIRITNDASVNIYNGWSSWVYMEEILGRPGAYCAFWWSPDGNRIAWLRTDETEVPLFTLNRLDEADGVHGQLETTHYPKPGDPNPKVRFGITEIPSGKTTWVKTDYGTDQYLAWPFWTPDSKNLAIQILNRDQNEMKYILAAAASGDNKIIYRETSKNWVEFSEDVYVMKNGRGFILRSYVSGWENLYFYGWDGTLIAKLTDVKWRVNGIERVDEETGFVYFTGTGPESTEKHYFRVRIDGKDMIQITRKPGTHNLLISPDGNYFIDTWNSVDDMGGIDAFDKNTNLIREIYRYKKTEYNRNTNSRTELVKILTSDGLFNLPALVTYPVNFDEREKYPVVFTVYGGPNSANVTNTWQGDNPDWYAENNIITVSVDHRGSGHFGMEGQSYMYRNLGKWEILDYEDAVKWLLSKPFVDSQRIGITGSSYGGYITCLALTKSSTYFTHGIAGSPVTDWRLYDNVYTERYMDKPVDNVTGYKESSALNYVSSFKGKLLLTHGDIDDNVHLQHSIQFISKLEDAGKSFEFMLYPGGRHGWGGAKRIHLVNEAHSFWLKNFFGIG